MTDKEVLKMIEWLYGVWTTHDIVKPFEYCSFSATTEHSKFTQSFGQESQEIVTQALEQVIEKYKKELDYDR